MRRIERLAAVINNTASGHGQASGRDHSGRPRIRCDFWEILQDETSVNTLAGRLQSRSPSQMICHWQEQPTSTASEIVKGVMADSGYPGFAKQGTDEAQNRLENIQELYNAVQQFEEETKTQP